MEDEFYNLAVKGNDLKTYIRRFQELAILCPNMVPNTEKLIEVFISGLPRSIEGNVTVSKPQTLEEAINISQRLMDQIIKRDSVQETNDHWKRIFTKGRKTKPKTTKLSTEWKGVKRRGQIEAKESIKPKSQTVKVKVKEKVNKKSTP
ncbi:hypothetical protein Tco_1398031 [Tanacetum coccineum]